MNDLRVTQYGLRHSSGYVFVCQDLQHALDLKSGARLHGKRGAWANHEVVSREVVTTYSDWKVSK